MQSIRIMLTKTCQKQRHLDERFKTRAETIQASSKRFQIFQRGHNK